MNRAGEGRAKAGVLLSMAIFGTIGVFVRYIPLPSGTVALTRGAVGTLFLLLVMAVTHTRPSWPAIRKNLLILCLSGAALGVNWILLFEAYRYVSVATATLCYYMAPVLIILVSPLLLKEKLTPLKLLLVAVACVGMVLVSGVLAPGEGSARLPGVLLGLGAAVMYACVVLLNKRLIGISSYDTTAVQLCVSAVVLLPYTLLLETRTAAALTPRTLLLLLTVGVLHTGVAYALYFGAIPRISAQTAAVFSYVDPVVAIVLSALLLHERMDAYAIVGAVLILGATLAYELTEVRKPPSAVLRPMRDAEMDTWYDRELTETFLPQERKPLEDIFILRNTGRCDVWGYFTREAGKERMTGYATVLKLPEADSVLLDYLGVTAALRGGGIGGKILKELFQQYPGRRMIVEAELPTEDAAPEENVLRRRRIGFYVRNGFVPVYVMATCGIRWQALITGGGIGEDTPEMQRLMREHKALYGPKRTDVCVPLLPDTEPPPPYWMQG